VRNDQEALLQGKGPIERFIRQRGGKRITPHDYRLTNSLSPALIKEEGHKLRKKKKEKCSLKEKEQRVKC